LIGRWIAPASVESTLKAFGMSEVAKMTPAQIRWSSWTTTRRCGPCQWLDLDGHKEAGNAVEMSPNSGYWQRFHS